jgi:hypothetical protein
VTPILVDATAVSTEAVLKVHGSATAGSDRLPWAVLVKILRSARHWPAITQVPPHVRQEFIDNMPWRIEADTLSSDLPRMLPPGLRTPRLFRADDLGDDRMALWVEFVEVSELPWDIARFRRAARLLGQLAGRRTAEAAVWPGGAASGLGLRDLASGLLGMKIFPLLSGRSLCGNALLEAHTTPDLRTDMLTLAGRVPAMLDRLASLTPSIGHGDACPQNLLAPSDAPDTLVAIDLTWQRPEAIGFDLGQLLVGLAHTGELTADELPELHDIVLSAYLEGLRAEGCDVDSADVLYGFDAAMVIRSAFTSMPWDELNDPVTPDLDARVASRAALTRYLVGVGLGLAA